MKNEQPKTPKELEEAVERYRRERLYEYREKYYNIWMNRYEVKELTWKEHLIIFRNLWRSGKIGCFKYGNEEAKERIFLPWALSQLDPYLLPLSVTAIPLGDNRGIPTAPQIVDKDCAIGYAQKSRKPLAPFVDSKINQIVAVEMLLFVHEFLQKMPLLIKGDSITRETMREMIRKVAADVPYIFISGYEGDNIDALINGSPYILDKLYQYRIMREGELLTFFGIDNNATQKKERMSLDEINANNALINMSRYALDDCIFDFFDRAGKVLGMKFHVISTPENVSSIHEEIRENGEPKDDRKEKMQDEE